MMQLNCEDHILFMGSVGQSLWGAKIISSSLPECITSQVLQELGQQAVQASPPCALSLVLLE